MTNEDYFKEFLCSIKTVKVVWQFDEAQADPFHNQFESSEFIKRLKEIIYNPDFNSDRT